MPESLLFPLILVLNIFIFINKYTFNSSEPPFTCQKCKLWVDIIQERLSTEADLERQSQLLVSNLCDPAQTEDPEECAAQITAWWPGMGKPY